MRVRPAQSIDQGRAAIRGICEAGRFLDIVENFTLFREVWGGLIKLVAKNNQYLAMNRAIAALGEGDPVSQAEREDGQDGIGSGGRGGVV